MPISGSYYYTQVVTRNKPESLTTPVSSSTLPIGTAISGSSIGGARYQFSPNAACFMRFVTQGVDPEATDEDTFLLDTNGPYFFTAPKESNGISVIASGSLAGFISITQLA